MTFTSSLSAYPGPGLGGTVSVGKARTPSHCSLRDNTETEVPVAGDVDLQVYNAREPVMLLLVWTGSDACLTCDDLLSLLQRAGDGGDVLVDGVGRARQFLHSWLQLVDRLSAVTLVFNSGLIIVWWSKIKEWTFSPSWRFAPVSAALSSAHSHSDTKHPEKFVSLLSLFPR